MRFTTRILRALLLQVMVTGLVLVGWGLGSIALQVTGRVAELVRSNLAVPGVDAAAPRVAERGPPDPVQPEPGEEANGSGMVLHAPLVASGAGGEQAADGPSSAPEPAFTPTPFIVPTATPRSPAPPDRLVIPVISLEAPVHIMPYASIQLGQDVFASWRAPNEYAAGWHEGSAFLGEPGNTVLSGHHNVYGSVFARLSELQVGDSILVYGEGTEFAYTVSQVMKLEERGEPVEQRIENARWLLPSTDERLTLVTCWPLTSNTHRLVVVAVPSSQQ